MQTKEIYEILDTISPFELQERWDNSGLIVGDMSREVNRIVVSLDIDRDVLRNVEEGTLFITHHPLIFSGLKRLDFSLYPSNLLEIMVQKRLSLIAMHTNFDKTHLNRFVFEKVLGFTNCSQEGFVCKSFGEWSREELFKLLRERMELEYLRVVSPKDRIESIALITGAGASLMDGLDVDCLLTGDIKYHDGMKGRSQNLMMVDIGHYESEKFFVTVLMDELKDLAHLGIISQSKNPFKTIRIDIE